MVTDNSKDNPTCYHGALNYLAGLTGISRKIEQDYDSVDALRDKKGKLKVKLSSVRVIKDGVTYNIRIKNIKGGELAYICDDQIFPIDTKFERLYVVMDRKIEDYGVPIVTCGTYKDSLGGGWHSNVPLYRVNDFYFAYMECAC